jgi:uncharacterized alkaline shock family protein YloU
MTAPLVHREAGGSISVTATALERLVVQAAELVDGARVRRPRRALEIAHENGRVSVSLELSARYGSVLPEVARAVQERVAAALEQICGLAIESVDVTVSEVRS